jgi:hypothetical protein
MENEGKEQIQKALQPDAADEFRNALDLILAAGGGPIGVGVALLGKVLATPLQRRRDKLLYDVAIGLARLQEQGRTTVDDVIKNENFLTAIATAVDTSIRTSSEEKRAFLRNFVLNSALDRSSDEDLLVMLSGYVDQLTAWHMKFLQFFHEGIVWSPVSGIDTDRDIPLGLLPALRDRFPQLQNQPLDFMTHIYMDLYNMALAGSWGAEYITTDDSGADMFSYSTRQHPSAIYHVKNRCSWEPGKTPLFITVVSPWGEALIDLLWSPLEE